MTAPAAAPATQPAAVPSAPRTNASAAVINASCQRRAPAQKEAPPRRRRVPPQAQGREHGECEEQGGDLAADQQQAPPARLARRAGRLELLGWREHLEGGGYGSER